MSEPPAFQFYASDFLGDPPVLAMSYEERGVYITLLCIAWMEEGIPSDLERVRKMLHMPPKKFERAWETIADCWHSNGNGQLVNRKMERVRTEQRRYREQQSKAGKLGMKKRWSHNDDETE